jgi:RNA polymerase sigma factor (sigma-70 family)
MTEPLGHVDPTALLPLIDSYRSGDGAAGDRLCQALLPVVRLDMVRMLGDNSPDVDDVVQEALVACLGYVVAEKGFSGDLVRLAVTIARNRCRDLIRWRRRRAHVMIEPLEAWLADSSRSALDELVSDEMAHLVQLALDQLPADCRQLLLALYVEGRTPEEMRLSAGLSSVHGVYYRRGACLERVRKILQRQLRFGSGTKASPEAGQDRQNGDSPS